VVIVTTTWMPITVMFAEMAPILEVCWLSITYPTPGRLILVFGAGVPPTGIPATDRPANWVPAALTDRAPVELSRLTVLTEVTALADTRPLSRLTEATLLEATEATPVAVVCEAALVSSVPVASAGGAFTDTAVLVFCTPGCETQPRTESAERPDCTIESTFTCVPYALP
jgi:hypothetical protein